MVRSLFFHFGYLVNKIASTFSFLHAVKNFFFLSRSSGHFVVVFIFITQIMCVCHLTDAFFWVNSSEDSWILCHAMKFVIWILSYEIQFLFLCVVLVDCYLQTQFLTSSNLATNFSLCSTFCVTMPRYFVYSMCFFFMDLFISFCLNFSFSNFCLCSSTSSSGFRVFSFFSREF